MSDTFFFELQNSDIKICPDKFLLTVTFFVTEKTNKTAAFPDCCPIFTCEEGAKLEYPEIPTVAPVPEDASAEASTTPKAWIIF